MAFVGLAGLEARTHREVAEFLAAPFPAATGNEAAELPRGLVRRVVIRIDVGGEQPLFLRRLVRDAQPHGLHALLREVHAVAVARLAIRQQRRGHRDAVEGFALRAGVAFPGTEHGSEVLQRSRPHSGAHGRRDAGDAHQGTSSGGYGADDGGKVDGNAHGRIGEKGNAKKQAFPRVPLPRLPGENP